MKNKEQFYRCLVRKEKSLQNKIDHLKFYNIRNLAIRALLKSGIAIDYALPFLVSSIIIGSIQAKMNITPFILDEKEIHPSVETIDTSSGFHLQNISYDFSYDEEAIEYTTGWKLNKNGLYERVLTSYRISNDIDITNVEKLLSMSKEELDAALIVTNIEKIYKQKLNSDDKIYAKDAIIVINNSELNDECRMGKESINDNLLYTILYIIILLVLGGGFKILGNIFIKNKVRDKFRDYQVYFQKIDTYDLETLKKMLQVEKENLSLLADTTPNINKEDSYIYKLRNKKVSK